MAKKKVAKKKVGFKIPAKMGAVADLYYETRKARLALQKEVDALKDQETKLKAHIIDTLPKSSASGISGKIANVKVITEEEPVLEDEEKFRAYCGRAKRHDLAYKIRPASAAVKEMWENGKKVPGVGSFKVVKVSLTKV